MTTSTTRPRAARPRPVVRDRAIRRYQPTEPKPSASRFVVVAFALFALLGLVVGKLVYVQGFQHERFKNMAVNQVRHTIPLAATRGSILDRNGRDLALSIERTTIYADPSLVVDPLAAARALSPVLNVPVKTLQTSLTKPGRFVYLARKVDDATAKKVKNLHLAGIATTDESARLRPAAELAAPLIGSVGVDNEGLGGLEHRYEQTLAGKPGSIVVDADRHLRRIASGEKTVNPSIAGNDLELTIDRGLQYDAERLLADKIVETRSNGGIALVMNTQTGDILAMANLTATKPGGPVVQAPRNSAVTDVYEPGSVNKLITITGALEDGAIRVGDRLSVPDRFKVGNHVFSDHDPHAVKSWSPTDIMRESSNIGTIMIAQKLGRERMADYLKDFGFGTKTGIDFPGESAGLLRPAASWYSTDMGSIPIGQGVSVSALQMLAAYNAVANGGEYVSPRLVRATIDSQGVRHLAPEARTRRAVSVSTAAAVTAMLEEVVESGTGTLAQIPGYRVAGKTGTARKPAPGGKGYIDGAYMSSFAGFAPADHPAITALVMLDEPTPIFGGLVAAPVFSSLARAVLREMRVAPSTAAAAAAAPAVVTEQVTRGDGDVPIERDNDDVLLSAVVNGLDAREIVGDGDPDIRGVTHDSRRVHDGYLFCCLPGGDVDGHDFASNALNAGAAALLCARPLPVAVPQVVVSDPRRAMAVIAANFWRRPARDLTMVGVTGTNGKTTTVAMVTALFEANAIRTATIGTLSAHIAGAPPNVPESSDLQALLATFRDDGFNAVAMEVSSQALVAHRVDEVVYDVAAFTNLSQDHLDLHGTMENYFAAKASLFTPERARAAVICIDDEWGSRLAGLAVDGGVEVVRCSVRDMVVERYDGPHAEVRWHGAAGALHLAGEHNIANAVVAANVGEVLGLSADSVLAGLSALQSVPGRFEYVDSGQPFLVVVDYAHTPDGVEVALRAARAVVAQDARVTIVVGCGGDRDRAKRPRMAAAAESLADQVVLTSDNPRSEDPRAILEEMQAGLRDPSRVIIDPDRASAIRVAIEQAAPGDVVLIAGKGHETTQTVGDDVLPFDDRDVARRVLAERAG